MHKGILAGICGVALMTGGCGKKADETAVPTASPSLDAPPENAPGVTLSDAVVQLPAVTGGVGVAYFTLSQGNGAARKLVAVHVDGAGRAEMHESRMANGIASMEEVKEVPIEPGKAIQFAPGGYHVMLFNLDSKLKAGGVAEVTITLDNGDKASIEARITGAGGADMGHM